MRVPQNFDDTGNPVVVDEQGEMLEDAFTERLCTKEEALEVLSTIADKQPSRSVFDIWKSYFMRRNGLGLKEDEKGNLHGCEVCPIGFLTDEVNEYISLENSCSKYHVLPYEGGWSDQLLIHKQAFEAVQIASNHYERDRASKMRREANKNKPK